MIGVIGLGKMGRAIAGRLEAIGETIVVWNRTAGRADGLTAEVLPTPGVLCERAELILSVLSDDAAIDAVYGGERGILSADLTGRTVVDFCTMSPNKARELEKRVTDAGGAFLECPVGGTIGPAEKGALLGLAGGQTTAFEAARPTLEKLTRRLEHVGPVGSGSAMKLAINLPLMVYWSALGEALGLAMAENVDPTLALDILADSSGAIGAAKARVPPIREMVVNGDPGGVNFALQTALKDMGEMIALAKAHGVHSEVISAAMARAARASVDGWSDRDASLTAAYENTVKGRS
ncbi:MAG: NAD(P)-dependent oxidoreductase [Paracoccaceae bacterium]|nr:NAD(P)-dependent oxidoreductase [Paracoccaceae bacterium]